MFSSERKGTNQHSTPNTEVGHCSDFTFLPDRTRDFLRTYEYKGVRSPEVIAPDVPPGVIFLTADIKVPEQGKAKILEFNGVGSHLEAYPEGGEIAAVRNIYRTLQALDRPVYVLSPEHDSYINILFAALSKRSGSDVKTGLESTLIGTDVTEGKQFGITYTTDTEPFSASEAKESLADLGSAHSVIWLNYSHESAPDIDTGKHVVINPKNLADMADDKLVFRNLFLQRELEEVRPRSWILNTNAAVQAIDEITATSKDIDKFILKLINGSGGMGVVPIRREDFGRRIREIFVDPFNEDDYLPGDTLPVDGWLRKINKPYLVEEFVSSKPIQSTKDGKAYDGTLRIAFMGIANQGKMAIVPICGYWKLPSQSVEQDWNVESVVSNVHQNNPSEAVSPEDFAHALESLIVSLPVMLRKRF